VDSSKTTETECLNQETTTELVGRDTTMVDGAAFIVQVGRDNEEDVLSFDQLRERDSSIHRQHEVTLFAIFDTE
jgi:hypothetical protein